MQDFSEIRIIERIEGERLSEVRTLIQHQLAQGQDYIRSSQTQPLDSASIAQFAQERLTGIIGRIRHGDALDKNPYGETYHEMIVQTLLEQGENRFLSKLTAESEARGDSERGTGVRMQSIESASAVAFRKKSNESSEHIAAAIFAQLKEEEKEHLALWQRELNFQLELRFYDDILRQLESSTSLELIVPLGLEGTYAGSNEREINEIEPHNQLDWMIRAVLNFMQKSSSSQRGVYVESSHTIWLGCANIKETISADGMSEYDVAQLLVILQAGKPLSESHKGASLIFNTRTVHRVPGCPEGMGHYETFLIRPLEAGFKVFHLDSQTTINGDIVESLGTLTDAVVEALNLAGFSIISARRAPSRYDQNALSCGSSAVGEVMDHLIPSAQLFDGFLEQADQGRTCCYNDLSARFFDLDNQALTREVFMRLVQYYFVASQKQHTYLQHLLTMRVFGCFLRDKDRPEELYPVPPSLLEQYAKAAYPSLFNVDKEKSLYDAGVVTTYESKDNARLPPHQALTNPRKIQFFPQINNPIMSSTQAKRKFMLLKPHSPIKEWMPQFIFNILTHPCTRYASLIVYFAAVVGLCIAACALSANPAALIMMNGLVLSSLGLCITSGSVGFVSGALATYGFLSAGKIKTFNDAAPKLSGALI